MVILGVAYVVSVPTLDDFTNIGDWKIREESGLQLGHCIACEGWGELASLSAESGEGSLSIMLFRNLVVWLTHIFRSFP